MNRHALLVQAHRDIGYFIALAKRRPNLNIYVHIDAKSSYSPRAEIADLANVFLLDNRVSVRWGGFSQVAATLALFEAAFANPDNQFFHLVSGEDVVLQDFAVIEKAWQQQNFAMMMTCDIAPQYAYRFVMDSPHADQDWQRKLSGKVMTKLQQGLAKVVPYNKPIYFGSQWFSVTRDDWAKILPYVDDYREFFQHKLVPDEHFFQTLIQEKLAQQIRVSDNNQRRIIFDKNVNNGNSPIYLNLLQLERATFDGCWFARKVTDEVAMNWLMGEKQ